MKLIDSTMPPMINFVLMELPEDAHEVEIFEQFAQVVLRNKWVCEVYKERATGDLVIFKEHGYYYKFDKDHSMGHVVGCFLDISLVRDKWLFGTTFEEELAKKEGVFHLVLDKYERV